MFEFDEPAPLKGAGFLWHRKIFQAAPDPEKGGSKDRR
jgi:hypothetical protein